MDELSSQFKDSYTKAKYSEPVARFILHNVEKAELGGDSSNRAITCGLPWWSSG